MAVQKVGKWISVIFFLGAVAAAFDLAGNLSKHGVIMFGVVVFQLFFSIVLYLSALKINSSDQIDKYRVCCWIGVFYTVLLSAFMGLRQYNELGFTVVLPITTIIFMAIFSAPFIWSIKKLNAMKAAEN